ncbi:DUF7055 domain-containing protein [Marinobacter alexandrii]|uniref:DUF7055 domain-containing protein n=1 Tax=Marinobacter alexandrii TaxID=2570351 RepID=UPI00329948AC
MTPLSSSTMRASQTDGSSEAVGTEGEKGSLLGRLNIDRMTPILLAVLAIKITLLFALSINSVFVMDEFVQLGFSKYLGNGLFDTIWPVKAVGYAVFYKLAHLLGWDAVSTLMIGRVMTAVLGCTIITMVYCGVRAMKVSRAQALLVVVALLSFSTFIERIFRTRSEPLAVFFAMASLMILLRGGPTARRIVIAGILTGLAFVTTQKSIYFNVALGGALLVDAIFLKDIRLAFSRGALLVGGWLIPVAVYCVAFGGLSPMPVLHNLIFGPTELVSTVPALYEGMSRFILDTLSKNALLYLICLAGIGIELTRINRLESRTRVALVFTALTTLFVFLHNQPWPYIFVMALPFMVMWLPSLLRIMANRSRHLPLALVLIITAIVTSFFRNAVYLTQFGNADQLAVVRNAESLSSEAELYFDGVGMLPNRSEPSPLWLDLPLILRTQERGTRSELYAIFSQTPPHTVIRTYRLEGVEPVIRQRLRQSYVKVAANILLPGQALRLGEATVFDVPISGQYMLYSDAGQPIESIIEIDGTAAIMPIDLEVGKLSVKLTSGARHALLVPQGTYVGKFDATAPDLPLFDNVYD